MLHHGRTKIGWMEEHRKEALVLMRDASDPALTPLDSVCTSGPASGDSEPTSGDLWSGRDTPFTDQNAQRFAEEQPRAPGDHYADQYVDAEADDNSEESALLSSGEPCVRIEQDEDVLPDEASAPLSNAMDVPDQRPNSPLVPSEDEEDFPPANMLRSARTLASTMVILNIKGSPRPS